MFIVQNYSVAVVFCFITMLCWGSWANTQKLTTGRWRFELFYWDYVIGILLTSLIAAFTIGSTGEKGRSFLADFHQASIGNIASSLLGGVIFNLANILLTAAIAIAGMSVAFPVGIGIALILGVLVNYIDVQKGSPALLFSGVLIVAVAIILNALAYRKKSMTHRQPGTKGIILSVVAGVLMSFFYRFIAASMDLSNFEYPAAEKMTPYTAFVIFAIGIFISNILFNTIMMRRPLEGGRVTYRDYFSGKFSLHAIGILGGLIWGIGNLFNLLAANKAGPAISYGLGQGATLIAAIWGVLIWKEFKNAGRQVNWLIAGMFLCFLSGIALIIYAGQSWQSSPAQLRKMPLSELKDKIRGGWAGQTIGVTFGGPYEFRFCGTFIQDYQPLVWNEGSLKKAMTETPGLYDDIYMDLTFVDILERMGFDAPVDSFANAFAHAGYDLWFANQAARYNILHGIKAPLSGHPENSLHADAIDYQIESDYSGLMNPGMPNSASAINDKIGHIMNYGDGWYGGVFMGAMYTQAFISNDIHQVVETALKAIPEQSDFYQCIHDVILWNKKYPDDWHNTWFELQKKWSEDKVCPQGVFVPFNIDAKINAAYVVMGLLYGNGDFTRTLEVATRAGQDADCNPSSAGGILGTMLGYNKIPAYWKMGLSAIENINFSYTTISLNKVYVLSLKHAMEMIRRNGGSVDSSDVWIKTQTPQTVRYEKSFDKIFPVASLPLHSRNSRHDAAVISDTTGTDIEGTGFCLMGQATKKRGDLPEYTFVADLYIDGRKTETAELPTLFRTRRHELFWKLNMPKGKHHIEVVVTNPSPDYELRGEGWIVYSDVPNSLHLGN